MSPSQELYAVVKPTRTDDRMIPVAKAAVEAGATGFCVANVDEDLEARQAGFYTTNLIQDLAALKMRASGRK